MDDFLTFKLTGYTRKTSKWDVLNKTTGEMLGVIYWYSPWRKYCFHAREDILFDTKCLNQISKFIESEMNHRKELRLLNDILEGENRNDTTTK